MGVIVNSGFSKEKFEKFLNKTERPLLENDNKAYRHLVKADALRIKNYFWESIDEYLNSLKYDDTNPDTYVGLAYSYKQTGYIKSALSAFNKAKSISPFHKELFFEVGCCYCIDKKFSMAIKEYKRALQLSPDFFEAKFNLAFTYELNNMNEQAVREYKKIIQDFPDHIKSYNNLGGLYMKLDQYKQAIKVFKELIKIDSSFSRAYLGIAISSDKLKDTRTALRYYKKYLKLNPGSENLAYIQQRVVELTKSRDLSKKSHLMLVS